MHIQQRHDITIDMSITWKRIVVTLPGQCNALQLKSMCEIKEEKDEKVHSKVEGAKDHLSDSGSEFRRSSIERFMVGWTSSGLMSHSGRRTKARS